MQETRERFADKLAQKERADEAVFFARRDEETITRLRGEREAARRRRLWRIVHMRCPECGEPLTSVLRHGIPVDQCPAGHGMWMTPAELQTLAHRERDSWISRYFYPPAPVVAAEETGRTEAGQTPSSPPPANSMALVSGECSAPTTRAEDAVRAVPNPNA